MNNSRLYRSTTQKVFGGVAGGIAEYFNIDPVIIRVIFVLALIFGGGGLIIYLVLWIAVPERPYTSTMFNTGSPPAQPEPGSSNPNTAEANTNPTTGNTMNYDQDITTRRYTGSLVGGVILIGVGALILATRMIPDIDFRDWWPFILVAAGVILIITSINSARNNQV